MNPTIEDNIQIPDQGIDDANSSTPPQNSTYDFEPDQYIPGEIVACADDSIPQEPAECKDECSKNESFITPTWFSYRPNTPFLNEKEAAYWIRIKVLKKDIGTLSEQNIQSFAERESLKLHVSDIVLDHYGISKLNSQSVSQSVKYEKYYIDTRKSLYVSLLFSIDCKIIKQVSASGVVEPVPAFNSTISDVPASVYLKCDEIDVLFRRVPLAIEYFGFRFGVWLRQNDDIELGFVFEPKEESKQLKKIPSVLNRLAKKNGYSSLKQIKGLEIFFSDKFSITKIKAHFDNCPPVPLKWSFGDDHLGGLKHEEPFSDKRTMAYLARIPEMYNDIISKNPPQWNVFFERYTYPQISFHYDEKLASIEGLVVADQLFIEPTRKILESVLTDIVSLEDAIAEQFNNQLCKPLTGKKEEDIEIESLEQKIKRGLALNQKRVVIGDRIITNLSEVLGEVKELDPRVLWENVLDPIGKCNFNAMFTSVNSCLLKGMKLEESLPIIAKAGLNALKPLHLEKVFVGLPPSAQNEIMVEVAALSPGILYPPWAMGYGKKETSNVSNGTINSDYYGTFGDTADAMLDVVIQQYSEAIFSWFERNDAINDLLDVLDNFPGSAILKSAIQTIKDCPYPVLFSPPVDDFLKTANIQFTEDGDKCKFTAGITLPKLNDQLFVPNFRKVFLNIVLEVIASVIVKAIIEILEKIINVISYSTCGIFETVGESFHDALKSGNNLSDSLKKNLCRDIGLDTGCDIDVAVGDLLSSFTKDSISPTIAKSFIDDVNDLLTQKDLCDLLSFRDNFEATKIVSELVDFKYADSGIPNTDARIKQMFKGLGAIVGLKCDLGNLPSNNVPVNRTICAEPELLKKYEDFRCELLKKDIALTPQQCERMLNEIKASQKQDLEDFSNLAESGFDIKNLVDEQCSGLLEKDDPVTKKNAEDNFRSYVQPLEDFLRTEMGEKEDSLFNMVLSNKKGRGFIQTNRMLNNPVYAALGIELPKEAFPETIGKYYQNRKFVLSTDISPLVDFQNSYYAFTFGTNNGTSLNYVGYDYYDQKPAYAFNINYYQKPGHIDGFEISVFDYELQPYSQSKSALEQQNIEFVQLHKQSILGVISKYITIDAGGFITDMQTTDNRDYSRNPKKVIFKKFVNDLWNENVFERQLDIFSDIVDEYYFDHVNNIFMRKIFDMITEDRDIYFHGGDSDIVDENVFDNVPQTEEVVRLNTSYRNHKNPTETFDGRTPEFYGGTEENPSWFIEPFDKSGWNGIYNKAFPPVDCKNGGNESRVGLYEMGDIVEDVSALYDKLVDDKRLTNDQCVIEGPYDKALTRYEQAYSEILIRSTLRTILIELFASGLPAFSLFEADFKNVYDGSLKAAILLKVKNDLIENGVKGFGVDKQQEFYFNFLERAVQIIKYKQKVGAIVLDDIDSAFLKSINEKINIWLNGSKKSYVASSRSFENVPLTSTEAQYAGTGLQLKQLENSMISGLGAISSSVKDITDKKKAHLVTSGELRKARENVIFKDCEEMALKLLSIYIDDELRFVVDFFSSQIKTPIYNYKQILVDYKYGLKVYDVMTLDEMRNGPLYDRPKYSDVLEAKDNMPIFFEKYVTYKFKSDVDPYFKMFVDSKQMFIEEKINNAKEFVEALNEFDSSLVLDNYFEYVRYGIRLVSIVPNFDNKINAQYQSIFQFGVVPEDLAREYRAYSETTSALFPFAYGEIEIQNLDLNSYEKQLYDSLLCKPEFEFIFEYIFSFPRAISLLTIHAMKAFIASVGSEEDGFVKNGGVYIGPGLGLRAWNRNDLFSKTKKNFRLMFNRLYNSRNTEYESDEDSLSYQESAREKVQEAIKTSKEDIRLLINWPVRKKQIRKPTNSKGELC